MINQSDLQNRVFLYAGVYCNQNIRIKMINLQLIFEV